MAVKDLNSLLVFAMIVEAKSYSEAARRLKMPISTVNRRIVELEDHLGACLLERSTHAPHGTKSFWGHPCTEVAFDVVSHDLRRRYDAAAVRRAK
jgi:hypothetical protein